MQNKQKWQVGAGEFKTHCLQLIDEASQHRMSLIITKHGKPLAKLVPFDEQPIALFGCLKDSIVIHGDIIEGTGELWDADE